MLKRLLQSINSIDGVRKTRKGCVGAHRGAVPCVYNNEKETQGRKHRGTGLCVASYGVVI